VVALDGVSLHAPAGAVFGILGESGAGKSTLIRCVNLLERPTSGAVVVDGQELTGLPPAALRVGQLQLELSGAEVAPALSHLRGLGVQVEVQP
jgi:D-methionine transport system ATP-binding protein